MQEQIERDLKTAMLAGDRLKVETLKTLKSALQYEAVNRSIKLTDMSDDKVMLVLAREAKKRQEAADMYGQAGDDQRRQKEQAEKNIIDAYLPAKLSETELAELVEKEIAKNTATAADMGKVIGAVRAAAGASADGAVIAKLVKDKLKP